MVIDKIHGLQSTSLSLNDRFTMLASAAPDRVAMRAKRRPFRPKAMSIMDEHIWNNSKLVEQIARRLQLQARRPAIRQRLGQRGNLRRSGSEGNLNMFRSGSFGNLSQRSFGNLSQRSFGNRVNWRQSNGNLSRSASFTNLNQGNWRNRQQRGFRRRGAGNRTMRGRFRGGGQNAERLPMRAGRGTSRGGPGTSRGGRGRGRGRAVMLRNQPPKPVPTKEELDDQLDRYMAGTKAALDRDLEVYMENAMDLE